MESKMDITILLSIFYITAHNWEKKYLIFLGSYFKMILL